MADLEFKNLYKRYDQQSAKGKKDRKLNDYAVNDLNMFIRDGEFVGILGPSGCGKSTTLRMIAGLEDITGGQIVLGGRVVNKVHPKDRGIGLAFEDYAMYPPLNVYDNIAFCLKAKKMPKAQIESKVLSIAKQMKVDELLQSKVASLSGGQKQRVNIARALVRTPDLLLLDEPLSHLDGKMRQLLRTEIKRLHVQTKCTTILVTHDQMEALSLSDYIAIMNKGVLQQYGTPEEIYNDPANEFVAGFIGEPPMNLHRVTVSPNGSGGYWFVFQGGAMKINAPKQFLCSISPGREYTLGIRPTSMEIVTKGEYHAQTTVSIFENLGEERIISFKVGDEFLTLLFSEEKSYEPGDEVRIKLNEDLVYLFDPETGDRVR